MEVRVLLKICEACGAFFYRAHEQDGSYCRDCTELLKHFPTTETRKRRGRPVKKAGKK